MIARPTRIACVTAMHYLLVNFFGLGLPPKLPKLRRDLARVINFVSCSSPAAFVMRPQRTLPITTTS